MKEPLFVTEVDVPSVNLMEAKFQAVDMAKKIAWYAGYKTVPKTVNIFDKK